jgi:hypothetical protein
MIRIPRWNLLGRLRAALQANLAGQRDIIDAVHSLRTTQQAIMEELSALRAAVQANLVGQRDVVDAVHSLQTTQHAILGELSALRAMLATAQQIPRGVAYSRAVDAVLAADGRYADPLCLARYSTNVFSQTGEDGIIAEIFNRIGARDRTFVEIGIEDGRENTTRLLLETGWRGTWIEGSEQDAAAARYHMREHIAAGRLTIITALVTAENINSLLDEAGVPASFDHLSLDVDYNTPHLWAALRRRSRSACIEYNGHLPPSLALTVPYDPNGVWDGQTIWFGGSLKAIERIGRTKTMALVGCDLSGINAFFVAEDETVGRFREPFDAETHFQRKRCVPPTLCRPRGL